MCFVIISSIKPLTTSGTVKPIESRMLRFVVLLRLYCFKHSTTIVARKSFPRMTSCVQIVIVTIVEASFADITEMGVFPSMKLKVSSQCRARPERFLTLVAFPDLYFGTESTLNITSFPYSFRLNLNPLQNSPCSKSWLLEK